MLTPNPESLWKTRFLCWVRGGLIEIILLRWKIRAIAPLQVCLSPSAFISVYQRFQKNQITW